MRIALALLLTLLSICLAAAAAPSADPLAEIHQAVFVTTRGISVALPHGAVTLNSGVVAIFPGAERKNGGIVVGDIDLTLQLKPQGDGVLNLFHEIDGTSPDVNFELDAAYISAAATSEASLRPDGIPLAIRSWDQLDQAERDRFEGLYVQCYGDSWTEAAAGGPPGMPPGMGHPGASAGLKPRDPVGKEVFAAVWVHPQSAGEEPIRYDVKIDATGQQVSIEDFAKGFTLYQTPWTPEKGDLDPALRFKSIAYQYTFTPPSEDGEARKLGQLQSVITAVFSLTQDQNSISFISAPWLEITGAQGVDGTSYPCQRGSAGISPWVLSVSGAFKAGQEYTLVFNGAGEVPDSFDAIGYGGVYRFGTSTLWPGEDHPVDINMMVHGIEGCTTYLASGHGELQAVDGSYTSAWPQSTRNVMIAATGFPHRELASAWGKLEIYAPQELVDGIEQMEAVTSVGDMLDYYTSLWGEAQPGQAAARQQPVFLLPDEGGVQAFEDAGYVFILGTGGSYGSGAMGVPLVAHEVAHIWWGQGFSGPRWFTEGMANYAASKFIEDYKTKRGEPDPYSYRRYIINFALGSVLPLSFAQRDELDDRAAIYHNSAGFMLTCDNRLPYGLDGPLQRIYTAGLNGPAVDEAELQGMFGDQNESILPGLWDSYVVHGLVERSATEDETYREMVLTPGRENYVKLLGWLTPARRKMALGDYLGAQFCAEQALKYRSEPKDYMFIADLAYRSGKLDEALERAGVIQEMENLDAQTRVKAILLSAKIYRDRGDAVNEKAALEIVVKDGPAAGLISEVQQAQQRLSELK